MLQRRLAEAIFFGNLIQEALNVGCAGIAQPPIATASTEVPFQSSIAPGFRG